MFPPFLDLITQQREQKTKLVSRDVAIRKNERGKPKCENETEENKIFKSE
jgi:hypothetical protein